MRVYVAGKFENKTQVRRVQKGLVDAGHSITFDWTQCDDDVRTPAELDVYWRECAELDLGGVYSADAIVLIPHQQGKGQYIELGAALALNKIVVVLGTYEEWRERSCFFALSQIFWAPSEDVIDVALKLAAQQRLAASSGR